MQTDVEYIRISSLRFFGRGALRPVRFSVFLLLTVQSDWFTVQSDWCTQTVSGSAALLTKHNYIRNTIVILLAEVAIMYVLKTRNLHHQKLKVAIYYVYQSLMIQNTNLRTDHSDYKLLFYIIIRARVRFTSVHFLFLTY